MVLPLPNPRGDWIPVSPFARGGVPVHTGQKYHKIRLLPLPNPPLIKGRGLDSCLPSLQGGTKGVISFARGINTRGIKELENLNDLRV